MKSIKRMIEQWRDPLSFSPIMTRSQATRVVARILAKNRPKTYGLIKDDEVPPDSPDLIRVMHRVAQHEQLISAFCLACGSDGLISEYQTTIARMGRHEIILRRKG